jgi:hypothetical protein
MQIDANIDTLCPAGSRVPVLSGHRPAVMSQSWPSIVLPGRWPAVLSCLRFDLSVLYVDKSLGFSRIRTECNFSLVLFGPYAPRPPCLVLLHEAFSAFGGDL